MNWWSANIASSIQDNNGSFWAWSPKMPLDVDTLHSPKEAQRFLLCLCRVGDKNLMKHSSNCKFTLPATAILVLKLFCSTHQRKWKNELRMKIRVSMPGKKKRGEDPVEQTCPDRNCWSRALGKGGRWWWEVTGQQVPCPASAWFSRKAVSCRKRKN